MVTDEQVRRLRKLSNTEKNQEIAASKAGMDPTTARRYLGLERLPSEVKKERPWRTRENPFCGVWDAVQRQIQESPGLEAKTLFDWLQRKYPGRFSDGQIRTLQRRTTRSFRWRKEQPHNPRMTRPLRNESSSKGRRNNGALAGVMRRGDRVAY